jgi:hypothetical protein
MKTASLHFNQSDTIRVVINRNDDIDNQYSLISVLKNQARKKYEDLIDILEFLNVSVNLTSNDEVRNIFIEEGFQELLNIFDNSKSVVLDIQSAKKALVANEAKFMRAQKDLKNIVRWTAANMAAERKSKFRIYHSDEKWTHANEDENHKWISLGSFYCQWNIDDGYLNLDLARIDNSIWILKIEYPDNEDFDEKTEGHKIFIQSNTVDGILKYVKEETVIDFWEFVESLIAIDIQSHDLIKLRELYVISSQIPSGNYE